MADNIRDTFFENKANGALWDVAVSIKRGNPLPLDSNSVFQSYADLETYAAGVLAYPGQIVAVVNADSTGIYYLDQELAIQEVGKIPSGDNKSVEINGEVISIHDFGKAFYKYIAASGEVAAHYEKVEVSAENPWKSGLEPKVVDEDGVLVVGWYEPNPTTIEGVNAQVTSLQGDVNSLKSAVGVAGDGETAASGLFKEIDDVEADLSSVKEDVSDLDTAVNGTNGIIKQIGDINTALGEKASVEEVNKKANAADVYTKTEADGLLANKANVADVYNKTEIDSKDEALRKLIADQIHFNTKIVTTIAEMTDPGTLYLIKDDSAAGNDVYIEYVLVDGEVTQIGTTETDLTDYAKSADVYTKTEADNLLNNKANTADVYTKDQMNSALGGKADTSVTDGLASRLDGVDQSLASKAAAADLEALDREVDNLSTEVAKKAVATEVNAALDLKADKTALESLATKEELSSGLSDKITSAGLATALEPYAKTADVNSALDLKADKTALESAVETLNTSLNAKLDIASYNAEKSSFATDTELAEAIGEAPTRNTDDEGNVSWEGATGIYTNIYTKDEITDLIADITGGESAADVKAELNAYKTSTDPRIKALEEDVAALEEIGAQANVLEKVKINGVELDIEDKAVNIPVGGANLGVVKSSTAENQIAIDAAGVMSVNKINANNLVQTEGDFIILNGGSASINI